MQIQLRQKEIEDALKQYISQQGINLTNKMIVIEFTSGRKDNGLSAEITIEEVKQASIVVEDSAAVDIKTEQVVTKPPKLFT